MYGSSIGNLSIYIVSNGRNILQCNKHGTQGNKWTEGSFNVLSKTDFRIKVEGTTTGGYQGDIAVDDVSLDTVSCVNSTQVHRH